MKKLVKWILQIPHLFAKLSITWCLGYGSAMGYYAMRIHSHAGSDPTATLIAILGFFGGELLLLLFKTVLKKGKVSTADTEGDTYNE